MFIDFYTLYPTRQKELGRKQKDNAQTVGTIFIDDDGEQPIIRESARFPMRLEAEIFVDGLTGFDSKNDETVEATLQIMLEWSKDQTNWQKLQVNEVNDWAAYADYFQLTRKTTRQMRFIFTADLPSSVYSDEGSPVFIRAVRKNKMHVNGWRDRVYLTAIRTQQYNPRETKLSTEKGGELVPARNINERLADKFCRMGVKIKVNKNTEDALDRFYIIASMTARTWNNGWSGNKVKTSNPAALALEVLTGLIHKPSEYKDSEIDLSSFGDLYRYCEKQKVKIKDTGEHEFKLEANGVLTSATKKLDVVKSILATCDAGLYVNEFGMLITYYDDRQETPIGLLNPQRIVSMQETRNLDEKPDGYKVEFVDENADWSNDTRRILRPLVEENPGYNTYTTVKLEFTTNYYQAMWHARRMMAKEIHRPGEITVKVGKEGRYYRPGSLIKVQHEGFKHGIGSGEIVNVIYNSTKTSVIGFRLMEHFDISNTRDYFIDYFIVRPTNDPPYVVTKQIQSVGKYTNELMLTVPIPADSPDVPDMGTILSAIDNYPHIPAQVRDSRRYIVTGLSETSQGYDLSLVAYSNVIYDTTTIDEIEPYYSRIISANQMVPDGHVDTRPYDGRPGLEGQSTRQMYAKTSTLTAPSYNANNDNPGSNWYATPVSISTTEYLWEIQSQWRGDYRLTAWSAPVRISGPAGAAGTNAPRFLGAFAVAPSLTSPQIGLFIASHEDYFYYTGTSTGNFQQYTAYEWNANTGRWVMLVEPTESNRTNAAKYILATAEATAGAPRAVFSFAQIRSLVASSIFVDLVAAGEIELNNDYGRGGGIIKSKNYVKGVSGWAIHYNGSAEFNDVTVRGFVEALDGIFNGTLNVGNVWDNRGNVVNTNGRGFLALKSRLSDGRQIMVKDFWAYGDVTLGQGVNGTQGPENSIICAGRRQNLHHSIYLFTGLHITGSYTAAQIYSAIHGKLSGEDSQLSNRVPISGSVRYGISYTMMDSVSTQYNNATVSCISKTTTGYIIYGLTHDGTRIMITVTSSSITVGTQPIGASGTLGVTGTATGFIADFIFV